MHRHFEVAVRGGSPPCYVVASSCSHQLVDVFVGVCIVIHLVMMILLLLVEVLLTVKLYH